MSRLTIEQIVDAILDGVADDNLDALNGAIRKRKELKDDRKRLFISPGNIVRFNSQVRPKYLTGLEAEVIKINSKRIVVKFTDENSRAKAGRYGYGEFTTPVSLVEKVN